MKRCASGDEPMARTWVLTLCTISPRFTHTLTDFKKNKLQKKTLVSHTLSRLSKNTENLRGRLHMAATA